MFQAIKVFLRYTPTLVIRDSVHQKIFGIETLQKQSYVHEDKHHINTTVLHITKYINANTLRGCSIFA